MTGTSKAVDDQPDSVDTVKLPPVFPTLAVQSFGLTDRGKVRTTNQDQFLVAVLRKALEVRQTSMAPARRVQYSGDQCHLFVVADGMGGHAGGEQASALAIDTVEAFILDTFKWFVRCKGQEDDKVLADFREALDQANARVLAEAAERPELRGMGTTLTMAYSLNGILFVAHVGDSRCYLFRRGSLYRLTKDHSLVEEMLRRGVLNSEEAARHHWLHAITNVVGGTSSDIMVEVHKVQLQAEDTLLLCSDGLSTMIPDEDIASVLQSETDCERACRRLTARANEAGGEDNITVLVAHFDKEN